MKYIIIILLVTSCAKKSDIGGEIYKGISIIKIDKCEYIIYSGHNEGNIIHKQNCKNHKK
jgi:hypothetical protein